jgi:ABC-type bacteriocin/lantibiotic exporter with double-glycine peptidase domain
VTLVRRYRLFALSLVVLGVLAMFLSFFFLFVLVPIVPLGIFYLAFLFQRERAGKRLLVDEAARRRALLDRFEDLPKVAGR